MSQQAYPLSPNVHNPSGHSAAASSTPTGQRVGMRSPTDVDIARRAYQKYEARGRVDGFDREDWAAATRELQAEVTGRLTLGPSQRRA